MTYVVSDLHGDHAAFQNLLKKIEFTDDDILYVVGDIVDYGEDSMELLCEISMMPNVYAVVGDHDLKALRMLSAFDKMSKNGEAPTPEFAEEMSRWVKDEGGAPTLAGFRELSDEMREGVLDFLAEMTYYEELTVNDETFLMIHAGLKNFSPDREIDDYEVDELLFEPIDVDAEYYEDKTLVVGHVPTCDLPEGDEGRIYYGNGSICMDCGVEKGHPLGCLCLETLKEYYSDAKE